MRMNKREALEWAIGLAAMFAISAMFWYAAMASGQYGNPNDPYLDYQRVQRERESLELQRRQVEAIERAELLRGIQPLPALVDPWSPAFQAEPLQ